MRARESREEADEWTSESKGEKMKKKGGGEPCVDGRRKEEKKPVIIMAQLELLKENKVRRTLREPCCFL